MNRRQILLGAASLAGLVAAGCHRKPGEDQQEPPTVPAANSEQVRLTVQQAEEVVSAGRRYKIAVLFPFQGIPFWVNEAFGIFDQAGKVGVDVIWRSADGYENVDRQVGQLSELKSLGVDGVLLAATNFAGTSAAAEDLIKAGIPIVNHVTSTDSARISAKVLVDYSDIGRRQAAFMKERIQGGGEILMLNGPAGAEWSGNEVEGFKRELTASSSSLLKIAAERNSNPERIAAQRFVEDLIVRFPDAKGVFSVTDSLAMGAVDALRGAGKAGTTIVTTAGFSQETVEPIRNGSIHLNVDESPVLIGRAALNAIVSVLNGRSVAGTQFAPTPELTADSLGRLDLTKQWAPQGWTLP